MSYVDLKNVYKRYKMGEVTITASDGVSFSIEKGEFAVVVGSSGAGKTTILNILGGMDSCDEGQVLVDGKDIAKFTPRQLTEYRGWISALSSSFTTSSQPDRQGKRRAGDRDLPRRDGRGGGIGAGGACRPLDNFPAQLSGGEQQRVSIARALAKRPKLLLCDEPTGALDYNTGKNILKLLQDTCRSQQMTVALITHNQAITPMADRVIRMKNSKVTSITSTKTRPRSNRLNGKGVGL